MTRVSRIDQIRAVLKSNGPMTANEIAEKTGISMNNVNGVISAFRLDPGRKTKIRKAGKTREGGITLCFVYELSNEPDEHYEPDRPPSREKGPRYPDLSGSEAQYLRHLKEQSALIKPFRHWQDVAFYGPVGASA